MTLDDSRMSQNEGQGGLFLSRFHFSKWLTFPVVGHKKFLVIESLPNIHPRLKELHLGSNRITSLAPEHLETILNVRMLDLRENKITSIPDEIHCLQLLERLDITNNDLSALPFTLGMDNFNIFFPIT